MQDKTILLVANSLFTITNFRMELVELMICSGFEVVIVCPNENSLDKDNRKRDEIARLGVKIVATDMSRNGLNPISDLKYLLSLVRVMKSIRPAIVINYTIKPVIYGSISARFNKVDRIVSNMTGLGYVFTDKGVKAKFIRLILKIQLRLSLYFNHLVFFQNPDDLNLIRSTIGISERTDTSMINGSGVNLRKFKSSSDVCVIPKSFIFVGRLIKDKGIFEYLSMAERVKKEHPDATFTIIGAFDDHPSSVSKDLINKYVFSGVVDYRGQVDNVVSVLSEHEVMVLPSYREGTPRAVLESMAVGMPIITTDAPGCRETVVEGENGYLVPVRDVESLCIAVLRFINNPALIGDMRDRSLELVKQKYDVMKVNKKVLDDIFNIK